MNNTPATKSAGTSNWGRREAWAIAAPGIATMAGMAFLERMGARQAERKTPPAGKFIDVDGVRLHYVDRGEGPAIVLLHGNGVLLQDYEASGVLGLAAQSYRVLAFDRPGFGYSDRPRGKMWTPQAQAELFLRALQQLEVEEAIVVGHSWSVLVAIAMALDRPDVVSGLVLISGYYYGTLRPDVAIGSLPAVPGFGDVLASTLYPVAGLLTGPLVVKASFAPAPVSKKFADFPKKMALRPSQIRATAEETAMMPTFASLLSQRYSDLAVPTIVLAGEGDLITWPRKHARRFARHVPNAELRTIAGQGHLLHYHRPEAVVQAISDLADLSSIASLNQTGLQQAVQ